MSFVVKAVDSVKQNMSINVPTGVDEFIKQDVTIEFKYMGVSELKKYQQKLSEGTEKFMQEIEAFKLGELKEVPKNPYPDEMLARDLVLNIEGLFDENGDEIKYSKKLLKPLFDIPYFAAAFSEVVKKIIYGAEFIKALEKN
jgi:hypothetical protein